MYESSPNAHRGMFYDFPGVEAWRNMGRSSERELNLCPAPKAYREETGIDLSERSDIGFAEMTSLSRSLSPPLFQECAFVGRRGEPRQRLEGPAGTLGPRRRAVGPDASPSM